MCVFVCKCVHICVSAPYMLLMLLVPESPAYLVSRLVCLFVCECLRLCMSYSSVSMYVCLMCECSLHATHATSS